MNVDLVTGSRIREKRLDQGLRQADVADAVGISASYLNLIEHNKRRIGGKVLAAIAQVLEADVAALSSGADAAVIDGMRAAAARIAAPVEIDRAEDLASRYPGWAALIAAQEVRLDTLEDQVQTLTDRIANDPALAGALHNVITAVTSIRATAGILVSDDKIDADWQRRFHTNLRDDSRKLADESKALVSYLDKPKEQPETVRTQSAFEQAEAFIAANPALLEETDADPMGDVDARIKAASQGTLYPDALLRVRGWLKQYARDAEALPFDPFCKAAVRTSADPTQLAEIFGADLPLVFRRLAHLPDAVGLPPMGLVTCDGAGVITDLKAIPGFGLNRRNASCPLWPLFTALHQPGRPLRAEVVLPDPSETRFSCYAMSHMEPLKTFDAPALIACTMLVVADPAVGQADPIKLGTSCKICPRTACKARREPSVVEGF